MTYLPEKGHMPWPVPYGADAKLGELTLRQLEKDFALQGFALKLPQTPLPYIALLATMGAFLRKHDLLHGPALGRILYQLDMDEAHMRVQINSTAPADMYAMLAHEMLIRCFKKVLFRQQFSQGGSTPH